LHELLRLERIAE